MMISPLMRINLPISDLILSFCPPQSTKLGKVNYAQFSGPEEHVPARSIVFGIIDDANFDSPTFSHAQVRPARSGNDLN